MSFDETYSNNLEGWGFSFRRSQLLRYKKYIELIKKHNIKGKALEIGCGTGFFTGKYLWPLFKKNIVAIDISKTAIEKAKKRYPQIYFEVDGLPKTNFSDKEFHFITVLEVLYYLDRPECENALKEIRRILKDNGYMLVSVNLGEYPYFKKEEIKNLIQKEGFEIIDEDGMYIKTYYRLFESNIWQLLVVFSSYEKFKIKRGESILKKTLKIILNALVRNKLSYYSYGFIIRKMLKVLLYMMPVRFIDSICKRIPKEQTIYICLATKK